ncbi:YqaE/Pmp3 family membrane protein [Sediminibacterium sp.]|uniref:YqaE/Pmp3 family membrane protein n=1 Tax=Sediminibacterium sp. TaxID=1917865 RepID=UPI002735F2E2|nr:YqaE/Pmp3 family membrane protein [Sediminibacterium sp.]MDP3393773.1 YqaE/Pmp3 family membrane protein [Sediminibacterium sp.]MDP3568897.1 YqaE/Pmp3 family membrane protein [Sediminibacterium sp.]
MKKIIYLLAAAIVFNFSTATASSVGTTTGETNKSSATASTSITMDDAVVTDAMSQFKSLSRVDRKAKLKEVKSLMKEYKANKASATPSTDKVLLAILAILLPPLAVYLHEGTTNGTFWISVLLTLLFWIPGVIFALITVL